MHEKVTSTYTGSRTEARKAAIASRPIVVAPASAPSSAREPPQAHVHRDVTSEDDVAAAVDVRRAGPGRTSRSTTTPASAGRRGWYGVRESGRADFERALAVNQLVGPFLGVARGGRQQARGGRAPRRMHRRRRHGERSVGGVRRGLVRVVALTRRTRRRSWACMGCGSSSMVVAPSQGDTAPRLHGACRPFCKAYFILV
jgi:hypothetical protein